MRLQFPKEEVAWQNYVEHLLRGLRNDFNQLWQVTQQHPQLPGIPFTGPLVPQAFCWPHQPCAQQSGGTTAGCHDFVSLEYAGNFYSLERDSLGTGNTCEWHRVWSTSGSEPTDVAAFWNAGGSFWLVHFYDVLGFPTTIYQKLAATYSSPQTLTRLSGPGPATVTLTF